MPYLPFNDALRAFREFLSKQGQPTELKWINRCQTIYLGKYWLIKDDLRNSNERDIENEYLKATEQALGISFSVVCSNEATCFCNMYIPVDDYDASSKLIGEKSLKLSVPNKVTVARYVSSNLLWWFSSIREKRYLQWKESYFSG